VASHDRAFLDRVADHVLAIDPGGSVRRVPGGVAGWLAERAAGTTPGRAATSPGRAAASPGRAAASPGRAGTGAPAGRSAARKGGRTGPSPSTIGRQLRDTEQAMTRAQALVDRLTERLAGTTDHAELSELGSELATAQAELDALEERWLELAELQHG
jgi:ABC transport system ATP-binding/permease protein